MTGTSGPGLSLKAEAIGLAVMTELPLLVIDVQRAGPSTGLPTKTEQADLNQALFGRHGECPMPVLAARSPADCFDVALEAWRIAVRYMTPVIVLSDAYMANGSEPWRIPDASRTCRGSRSSIRRAAGDGEAFQPYARERAAGPALGLARHARADAPHRRAGEAGHHRRGELRPGQPPAHGRAAGREDRRHRPGHSAAGGRRPGRAASCWWSAGAAPTARWPPPSRRLLAARASRSPTPICATSIRCPANLGEILRRYDRCWCRS